MRNLIVFTFCATLFLGCGTSKEVEKLRAENMELKTQLELQKESVLKVTKMAEVAQQEAEKQKELAKKQTAIAIQAANEAHKATRKAKDCL